MNPTMAPRSRPPEMPAAIGSNMTMSPFAPNRSSSASSVVCSVMSTKTTNAGRAYFNMSASTRRSLGWLPQQHLHERKPSEVREGGHGQQLRELVGRELGLRDASDRDRAGERRPVLATREHHLVPRHVDLGLDAGIDDQRPAVALAVEQTRLAGAGEADAGDDVGIGEQLDDAAIGLDVDHPADQSGAGD